MSNNDFETLVHLCLESDSILIDGKGFKQQSGLAMGNNLAPILAIIYMNEIDCQIIDKTDGQVILKRYIDDYFAFILSRQISGDRLLTIANSINDAIKFTIELPIEGQLPFLDTMVTFNPETNNFSTQLYIKPIHSNCIVPWDSHGSLASKRAILVGEINRAVSRSTDGNSRKQSLRKLTQVFARNGYPKSLITATIQHVLHNQPRTDDSERRIYMKLPYINEDSKRRALAVIRRSGLNNIKIHFLNGKSSSQRFAPRKETMNCSEKCETCKLGKKPNRCHNKNVVYEIECLHCNKVYIGETGRTIGTRIKEHLTMNKQTIYKHIESHGNNAHDIPTITWRILHSSINHEDERKCIEAFEIKKRMGNLINGCIGRTINI